MTDGCPLRLGEQATDAIHQLNPHTRGAEAFGDPADLCWLLAGLTSTAQRMPQLLAQLQRWLISGHAHAQLGATTTTAPTRSSHP